MNKDRPPPGPARPSWLASLKKWLLRVPADNERLLAFLRTAQQNNLFDADGLAMIEGVLEVDDMQVRDVMVPRSQMTVVEESASPESFLPLVIESAHSRFPVMGDSRDEIVGILLAKDHIEFSSPVQPCNNNKTGATPICFGDLILIFNSSS